MEIYSHDTSCAEATAVAVVSAEAIKLEVEGPTKPLMVVLMPEAAMA